MKRQGSTELPRFIVGALAAAGASVASGATVQISFPNNVVSSATGTTNFVADLTGDGVVDVMGSYVASAAAGLRTAPGQHLGVARKIDGGTSNVLSLDGVGYVSNTLDRPLSLRGLVPFMFTEGRVGLETIHGWLDVTARAQYSLHEVRIHRLIFDDAGGPAPTGVTSASTDIPDWEVSAVPEPGSNLALLALGAGGLTLRRRLKRAA